MNKIFFTAGDKVSGTYYGQPFTGQIRTERMSTVDWYQQILHINLDKEIECHGVAMKSISYSYNISHGGNCHWATDAIAMVETVVL